MKKLTIIGAGSIMFTRQLLSALFACEALPPLTIVLEDLNPQKLKETYRLIGLMVEQAGVPVTLVMTTNQKEALGGADFVISAIQVGGLEPWRLEVDIPKKYGVDQEVGDTLGSGGIFRALRQIPPTLSVARDMEGLCPNALLLNYANPLAPLTWAVNKATSIRCIGLCYGVRYTAAQLAGYLGLGVWVEHPHSPEAWQALMYHDVPEGFEYTFGGINHMTWLLDVRYQGQDLYPAIRALPDNKKAYASDGIRCEVLKMFNHWCTENHWHMSDYVPWFRKNQAMINKFLPQRWNLLELEEKVHASARYEVECQLAGDQPFRIQRNMLNAPKLIEAMLTGERVRINGNLPNQTDDGLLIANLPAECMVEVPIYVDADGLHPVKVGALPTACAALNKTNINVQELVVEAALTGNLSSAKQALAMDPVTGMACTLEQCHAMFDELLAAQKPWLTAWYQY
ncbi:alpha-galactosidase [Endozoicomonas sp. Mp262]|uniref:alpha-galactosidase n=1 Tax=Endozoicomonas sp. Mp262 TaxID=2919499 RepID=UPI0021DAF68F